MAKKLPGHHSPLLALGKKILLWVILPTALVVAGLYVMGTYKSPAEAEADRVAQEMAEKLNAMSRRLNRAVEEGTKR
ncbi:MAG: hypothetical protein ACLPPF_21385 [Rhodomicrobium sp.]